jgi:hypothetical protein
MPQTAFRRYSTASYTFASTERRRSLSRTTSNMNRSQFFAELKQRNGRALSAIVATAALFVVEAAAILLGVLEAGAWVMKVLARALVPGKAHLPVRRFDRFPRRETRPSGWRS